MGSASGFQTLPGASLRAHYPRAPPHILKSESKHPFFLLTWTCLDPLPGKIRSMPPNQRTAPCPKDPPWRPSIALHWLISDPAPACSLRTDHPTTLGLVCPRPSCCSALDSPSPSAAECPHAFQSCWSGWFLLPFLPVVVTNLLFQKPQATNSSFFGGSNLLSISQGLGRRRGLSWGLPSARRATFPVAPPPHLIGCAEGTYPALTNEVREVR